MEREIPRCTSVIITLAPATAAPLGSVIVPRMRPVVDWASTGMRNAKMAIATTSNRVDTARVRPQPAACPALGLDMKTSTCGPTAIPPLAKLCQEKSLQHGSLGLQRIL